MLEKSGVPSKPEDILRRVRRVLAKGDAGRILAGVRARTSRHPMRRILILSDKAAETSEQQLAPLMRYRQAIASHFGLVFEFGHVAQIAAMTRADLKGYAAVGLKLGWSTPAADAEATAQKLFAIARAAHVKALVFDGDDDLCVLWPGVIKTSDVYFKKHRFADNADYTKHYTGKSNLTDYTSKKYGVSFKDNPIPATEPLAQPQIDKIVLGWNIALDDKIFDLAQDIAPDMLLQTRHIDIGCRASVSTETWIFDMRNDAVQAIKAMVPDYRIYAPTDRVSQQDYYTEMLRARLTVSPFGYGELCWRDFETILCGSVLVKPDMSHVATWPNLFVPHETYIPVAWDFSDLREVCTPYLDDDAARQRIAENAREKLLAALTADAFLERMQDILLKAGLF